MSKSLLIALVLACLLPLQTETEVFGHLGRAVAAEPDLIANAFNERRSGVQVSGRGTVVRLLPDDNEDSRHQKFILALPSGQTLLIAHNIDIAPRLESLRVGDKVGFRGVYEWNEKGGLIHWTHHDPSGARVGGWLRHGGKFHE
jgi:hypothetical protein